MSGKLRATNNAFLASGSSLMRNAMQNRRLASSVPYLRPVFDKLEAGSVICEVGCGPGGITLDIAQHYPGLIVLGMDIDEQSIKQANEAATAAEVKNVRYSVGDSVNLSALAKVPGFEALNGGCDVVYSHATVMHTGNALETIKQMRLASKPGGTVSMNEGDMGLFFAYPENAGLTRFLEVLPRLGAAKGADPFLGRKLMSHAMAVGYRREDVSQMTMECGTVSWPREREGVAFGYDEILHSVLADAEWRAAADVDEKDVATIMEGFAEFTKWDDGIIGWPSIIVNCVKAVEP